MISPTFILPSLALLGLAGINGSTSSGAGQVDGPAPSTASVQQDASAQDQAVDVPFVAPPDQIPVVEGGVFTRFYHDDGTVAREGYLKDGARVGVWKSWHPGGQRAMHGAYLNYVRVGSWVIYAEDGKTRTEAIYDDEGRRHGRWRTVFRGDKGAGSLRSVSSWKHGRKHGSHERYARNGKLLALIEYKDGRKHGQNIKFTRGGKNKQEEGAYDEGLQTGDWKLYYPDGVMMAQGAFKTGKRVGEWIEYYANGRRKSVGGFEAGLPAGPWQGYYKQGERKYLGTFVNGELDGDFIEWWPSGDKKGEGAMRAGRFDGPWTFWDREGREDPSKTGTYKSGVLIR